MAEGTWQLVGNLGEWNKVIVEAQHVLPATTKSSDVQTLAPILQFHRIPSDPILVPIHWICVAVGIPQTGLRGPPCCCVFLWPWPWPSKLANPRLERGFGREAGGGREGVGGSWSWSGSVD